MSIANHIYTACYCEENIYHLARLYPDSFTVFISNHNRTVPFWSNKLRTSAENEQGLVVWDYHVVLVSLDKIWDFDSAVPFPCQTSEYLDRVLRVSDSHRLPEQFTRQYRVIRSVDFCRDFASDRSHMLRDGQYVMPVPAYAAILGPSGETMNLDRLLDFGSSVSVQANQTVDTNGIRDGFMGSILEEAQFLAFCQRLAEPAM